MAATKGARLSIVTAQLGQRRQSSPSDNVCLEYTLRVACLMVVLDRRARQIDAERQAQAAKDAAAAAAAASAQASSSTPGRRTGNDTSLPSSSSSFLPSFDLSSLIGGSSKSPKYPEKFLKTLDTALQRVAMGKDPRPAYSSQRFRRTAALYWSSPWGDKAWQRQMKESRKVEDLILPFVTTATKSLKKDEELAEGQWKEELNVQIRTFLELLHENLRQVGANGELLSRLDGYKARVKDPGPGASGPASAPQSNGSPIVPEKDKTTLSRASSGRTKMDGETASVVSGATSEMSSLREKLAEKIGQMFGMGEEWTQEKVKELASLCTEQAALEDLKTFLKRLNTDNPTPYTPSDFSDPAQWAAYRSTEVSTLSQMVLLMMQANPSLVQSNDRNSTDLVSRIDGLKLDAPPGNFTFVPPDPRRTYHELLSHCLDTDLEILKTLPEDEDVSLGILSEEHVALLSECAVRWRLPPSFRAWVFLEAITERCEQGSVPAACVHEATAMVGKVQAEMPLDTWASSDREGLDASILRRNMCLLSNVDHTLTSTPIGYHSAEFLEAVSDWLTLEIPRIDHPFLDKSAQSIIERIRSQAFQNYIDQAGEVLDNEGAKTKNFILEMGNWVEKEAKKLNKKFSEAIVDKVDLVPLVLTQHLSLWFRDLEDVISLPAPPEEDMEESFVVYRKAQKLLDMGNAFSTKPLLFSLSPLFEPMVKRWLDNTNLKTRQWADQALAVDTFEPTHENGPSSSVSDLFDSFRSATKFLMDLDWPDEAQLAVFATRLSKIFSISLNDYCVKMEQLFAGDMAHGEQVQPAQTTAKQKAWIEKAKSTLASLQGEKKIQAFFNFTPASCVKLNDIEAARVQLDSLYGQMRVDELAAYGPAEPERPPEQQMYIFTVKVILAEGLALDDSKRLPDSYVIISDEHGTRFGKTRTIFDDTDPRWEETFDIPVRGSAWFMLSVRHRTVLGKNDLLGRSYLRLDPKVTRDAASTESLLPLDTRGHVLVRVTMEDDRDDIQFHFARAFRWLKRTEADMVRTFVDKMTPVLRSTLSRATIKSVTKPASNLPALPAGLDYNDALQTFQKISTAARSVDYDAALGKLTNAYRNALGTPDYSIPLPEHERRKHLPTTPNDATASPTLSNLSAATVTAPKRRPLTDAEIEAAIHPLFDYLDANISTLASTLSDDAMQNVISRLWKQVLATIDALIVPPPSDKPSHMRALSDSELDIALKWLKFLRDFFYAGGDEKGVPLEVLQNAKFNEIMSVRIYYDWATDDLMEECIRGFQSTLKHRATKMSKTLMSQRNLGTIRAHKTAKRKQEAENAGGNTEMIMRILRMRSGTQEFLAQQLQTLAVLKLSSPQQSRGLSRAGGSR